jgi:hypothetical protein
MGADYLYAGPFVVVVEPKAGKMTHEEQMKRMHALLSRIKGHMPELEEVLADIADQWGEEDGIYRFYHQSYKVFEHLQWIIRKGFALIEQIGAGIDTLDPWYCQIVQEGTAHKFTRAANDNWLVETRPILEAFWHTKYFLSMLAKYGAQLETITMPIPSGWAAVLCLFRLR